MTHIFQRGRYTTNQQKIIGFLNEIPMIPLGEAQFLHGISGIHPVMFAPGAWESLRLACLGTPRAGWFTRKIHRTKLDENWGYPHFRKPPHIYIHDHDHYHDHGDDDDDMGLNHSPQVHKDPTDMDCFHTLRCWESQGHLTKLRLQQGLVNTLRRVGLGVPPSARFHYWHSMYP